MTPALTIATIDIDTDIGHGTGDETGVDIRILPTFSTYLRRRTSSDVSVGIVVERLPA